jgi:hypothetical protein
MINIIYKVAYNFGPFILFLIVVLISFKLNKIGGVILIILGFYMSVFHPMIPKFGFWEVFIANLPANAAFIISGIFLIRNKSQKNGTINS